MRHIKLFENFLNETFKISSEKDGAYEKTDVVIDKELLKERIIIKK